MIRSLLQRGGSLQSLRRISLASSTRKYARFSPNQKAAVVTNYYEVLGVKPNATPKEIKAAFVQLSKQMHPDRNPNDPSYHDKFVALNEAYTVLSKPLTRREHDMTLAHRLYVQQNLTRNAGSHHAGSYPGPGTSGSYSGEERVFWDETIWHMRNKSKDANAFYAEDQFYGVRGIRRLPNWAIVVGCFGVMALGFLYFLLGVKWSDKKRKELLEKDRQNLKHLLDARARAKEYGNEKQLQRLASKFKRDEARFYGKTSKDKDVGKTFKDTDLEYASIEANSSKKS